MNDPFLLAANVLRLLVILLSAAAFIGLGVCIRDCWRAQRQARRIDQDRAADSCIVCGRPVIECRERLAADPEPSTVHAREFRKHFGEHCELNPTFPRS